MTPSELYPFDSKPGVRRDGTELDSAHFSDAVWTRWQRGKPRKMGGYRVMSQLANGPVRSVYTDRRNGVNTAHYFSQWGIQRQEFDRNGAGGNLEDRTPTLFTPNPLYNWSHGTMFSSTGGSYTALLAACTPDVNDIASDTPGNVYAGDINTNDRLTLVSDGSGPIAVSGGLCVLQPFLFVYGSNGLIRNSNANDFSVATGWATGGASLANSANVAGTKFVFGAPVRGGGQTPAGLFWALDSLVRVSFVGGTQLWNYDTLSQPTSILSAKAVIEHDGKFFWPGQDRFLFYNGVVQELPNQMNFNYFFDGLNYQYANKVWGTKIARWGELWWFYPRGDDTECGHAVIYNYREDTWYDAVKQRSAGGSGSTPTFKFPVWAGEEDGIETVLLKTGLALTNTAATVSGSTLTFSTGTDGVVTGMSIQCNDPDLPAGATVSSFTGTTVVSSAAVTGTVASGTVFTFSTVSAPFAYGTRVTGGTSGASGILVRATPLGLNLKDVTGTFVSGETVTGASGGTAVVNDTPVEQLLAATYQHELGTDKVVGQETLAIVASYTSKNFGFAVGGPIMEVPKTLDMQTRVLRIEPDYIMSGPLTFSVEGRSFSGEDYTVLESQQYNPEDLFLSFRVQARILRVKVESNAIGGDYQQGATAISLAPGDIRSGTQT